MKCLVSFAIFADFFRFLHAVLLRMFLLKLRQIFARKFFLQLLILVEFVLLAIFAISSIYF